MPQADKNAGADDPYEIDQFATKYGLTEKAAAVILYANGPSHVACDAAARAFVAAVGVRKNSGNGSKA